jgi:hypothetical protein
MSGLHTRVSLPPPLKKGKTNYQSIFIKISVKIGHRLGHPENFIPANPLVTHRIKKIFDYFL